MINFRNISKQDVLQTLFCLAGGLIWNHFYEDERIVIAVTVLFIIGMFLLAYKMNKKLKDKENTKIKE